MKIMAALLLLAFVPPAHAGIVWDESVNGELSHSFSTPTLVSFTVGSNVVNGQVGNLDGKGRDYLRFTIPEGHMLMAINLLVWTPDNTGFTAINEGIHSFFPSFDTEMFYLAGIHIFGSDVGSDLLDLMVTRSVTSEALSESQLPPGNYSMVIQQTAVLLDTYSMEFVVAGPVAIQSSTWGAIKALYR